MKTTRTRAEYWSVGVLEYCGARPAQRSIVSCVGGGVLICAGLLVALLVTGCGPSSEKAGKQAGTNVTAATATGKTNRGPALRRSVRTNVAPAVVRTPARTAPARPAAKAALKTNAVARAGTGTNAAPAAGPKSGIGNFIRNLQRNPTFYPTVGVTCFGLFLAALLVVRLMQAKRAKAGQAAPAGPAPTPAAQAARRKVRKTTVHSCNVLKVNDQARQLWQFDAKGRGFVLGREQTCFAGQALPAKLISKDWRSLFQRKLNIAWLPSEQVFLRVAQFPASDFDETLSMVELQLEKLSPMPLTQIVWSIHVLPHAEGALQTVIVMIVARSEVEKFLGQLEGEGYLADRLDLPLLDQLQTTAITNDGAWIYPEAPGGRNAALVAWWYGGVLQNLDLIALPESNRPESLKEQLLQMAWAGEMEGWLTAPPTWHLVAEGPTAGEWGLALRAGLDQPVEVIPPLSVAGLAGLTATRAAHAGPQANLLPVEYSARYHQQFVDRLWMRGLGAVVALYLLGVLVYFARLQVELYRTSTVEQQVAERGPVFTNALELKAKFQVLKDRQDLKFAALDCWKAVAELLPDGVTLEGYSFSDGRRLTLSGKAPDGHQKRLLDFDADIRRVAPNGQPLFDPNKGEHVTWDTRGSELNWHCILELKRTEAL